MSCSNCGKGDHNKRTCHNRSKPKKPAGMRTFYVYMHNSTDRRDDEVYKVFAKNKAHARKVANAAQNWPGRFGLGWVMGAREKGLASYKWWSTDKTAVRV